MNYRALGNTGLMVSEIGMGCEGFNENDYRMTGPLFDLAEKYGVNYFDLYASDPQLRAAVGEIHHPVPHLLRLEKRPVSPDPGPGGDKSRIRGNDVPPED